MNNKDYAVVVGISRYPGLGEQPGDSDLLSPDRDAQLVYDWLVDPAGGAVPRKNIKLVQSSGFPPTDDAIRAKPRVDEVSEAFDWLEDLAQKSKKAQRGQKVGRRLYIYMSGHGYSPRRSEGGLFTANATPFRTYNVHSSGWLQWFEDMGYFDEFILCMDSCMDRLFTVTPHCPYRFAGVPQPPAGPTFVAFAARRPLKTVERKIPEDGDQVHGVFTWALLKGLRGAAADTATGSITGASLRDYLINTMKGFLDEKDLTDPDISKEPHVPEYDDRMVFASHVAPATYEARLTFPAAAFGAKAHVWGGDPVGMVHEVTLTDAQVRLDLARGLYVVDVPQAGLRQGFELSGGGAFQVSIVERGPPVETPAAQATFNLQVDTGDPAAEIFVIDNKFALVGDARQRYSAGRPFGIYKIKTRAGREVSERVVVLDRDTDVTLSAPPAPSAAPLPGTACVHEYHEAAASDLAMRPPDAVTGAGSEIAIMTRVWTGPGGSARGAQPWKGVALVDARGRTIADLEVHGERHTEGDPFAVCKVALAPGTYYLRQKLHGRRDIEQAVHAPDGWRIEVYLLDSTWPEKLPAGGRQVSFFMHRVGAARDASFDRLLDTARVALADERRILSNELNDLLLQKFENPIAGILGAHLLLVEAERAQAEQPGLAVLNNVVNNLRNLVGSAHPDVEAISLKCPDAALRTARRITAPPLFLRSWRLMTEATETRPELVPSALWRRVRAISGAEPYLIWSRDALTRAEHLAQVKTLVGRLTAAPEQPPPARRLRGRAAITPVRDLAVPPPRVMAAGPQPGPDLLSGARALDIPANVFRQMWTEARGS